MKHATFDLQAAQRPKIESGISTAFLPSLGLTLADADQLTAVSALLAPGRRHAFFMNAHCCNIMSKDRQYADAVRRADMLLPDGIGVSLAGHMTGDKLTENLNGTDLTPALLATAADQGKSVYLFGGKPGTADAAAAKLQTMIRHLRIAGTCDGFEGARDNDAVIADINRSGADIVIVALGVPMQELWIDRHADQLNAQLCLGVGAALDFLAGNVMRAPKLVRRAKLEWIWRLAMEPKRMCKRYLVGNITFLARAAWCAMRQTTAQQMANRAMDIAIATTALIVLSPVLLGAAMAIKLDSGGSVLFRQTRVGKDGQTFPMLKFRSMHVDAEARLSAVLGDSDREGVCFKARNDPRVTYVGRFIRRTSIDELPQIINVLRGEMSIVGPRPALPREVALYPARALGRLAVKPGITGIWQVSGRANVSFDKMVEMDLIYARSRTIMLDLILILLTFRAVISGRGAY
ncbi:WecB/TagA/CpsF family glycosyltransferase [Yoonia sediminilitoris]|uniref:Exopolysaccharide biosynthesis WecB/TagA/CpsF family protein n=1 Tax=Yoonia sediminilitoris TaxID=1286148 RepID=A0A2T6KG20_9RHOB|nr:WecB/TagA/CpsF family glycosyltransferase [Yoonia sediminilitoris]PUB14244.1 exopolysaccharide biosynthesis WecB/TagA/CpsF family protein [Yoonia sediminilitoris]RCW95175.1 exopolysaccharide biosynthesis WecB/TagA/CpsF family protein [Yoonia sediminilitoris]